MAVALAGNNPSGISDGSFAAAQPGYTGANGRYASFATMQDGFNAQVALLNNYVGRGINTPASIATKWVGPGGGAAYSSTLANALGIGVNDTVSLDQLPALALAQAHAENNHFDPSTVNAGAAGIASAVASGLIAGAIPGAAGAAQAAGGSDTNIPQAIHNGVASFEEGAKNMFVRGGAVITGLVIVGIGLFIMADKAGMVPPLPVPVPV